MRRRGMLGSIRAVIRVRDERHAKLAVNSQRPLAGIPRAWHAQRDIARRIHRF